jgi:translation initiation factor IF-3
LATKKIFVPVNYQIKSAYVQCIDADVNIGTIPLSQAVSLAESKGLKLIQVALNKDSVPICKIMDYGKFKYDLSKKERETAKKKRESLVKIKEVKLHPTTETHDLETKAKQASEFLENGDKVKVEVVFRGRELSYKEIGYATLNKFVELVKNGVGTSNPVLTGKTLTLMLEYKK